MADLSNGSNVFQTYNNAGTGVAELGDNKKDSKQVKVLLVVHVSSTLTNTNMTQAELEAALRYIAAGDVSGTNDAHTIVAVSCLTEDGVFTTGVTDDVQVAIQGTGAFYSSK